MSEQPTSERDRASGAHTRGGRRFPISPAGWIGIAAAIVGIVYFALPDGAPEPASNRNLPRDAPTEVPPKAVSRNDATGSTAREKPSRTKSEEGTADAGAPAGPGQAEALRPAREPRKVRATASGPPTLYIHVRDDAQRRWAERMVVPLAQRGIHVAGIEIVDSGPHTRDLRYFGSEEPADAADIAQALREVGVSTQRVRRFDPAQGQARGARYELWLPPGRIEPPG
jgi:hypothetical protein